MIKTTLSLIAVGGLLGLSVGSAQSASNSPSSETVAPSVLNTTATLNSYAPPRRGGLVHPNDRTPAQRERLARFKENIDREAAAIKNGQTTRSAVAVPAGVTTASIRKIYETDDTMAPSSEVAPLQR